MKLNIAGLHLQTGDSLQAYCEEKMQTLKKYFDQVIEVDLSLREEHEHHYAEVTVIASGVNLRALGDGTDFFKAVDVAEQKLERQLKKYKGRLKKHRKRRQHNNEKSKIFQMLSTTERTVDDKALEDAPEDMFVEYAPTIVHKDVKNLEPMSVDEAVMQMDLLHKPAFLFQNAQTGKLNVVYREAENQIKWIEPGA